mgnify:CR=1 FL=1
MVKSNTRKCSTGHMTISLPNELQLEICRVACEQDMSVSALCRLLFREEIERYEQNKAAGKSRYRRNP